MSLILCHQQTLPFVGFIVEIINLIIIIIIMRRAQNRNLTTLYESRDQLDRAADTW